MSTATVVRLILGDQLNTNISALADCDKKHDVITLMEVQDEATYVKHHPKKIAFLFAAMRHFAQSLKDKGYQVDYIELDSAASKKSFTATLKAVLKRHKATKLICTEPGEYRVLSMMEKWESSFKIPVEIKTDDRFFATTDEFKQWAKDRNSLRMEYFYREMRKKTGILMQKNQKPVGGKWNYDTENRQPLKDNNKLPDRSRYQPDAITKKVLQLVEKHFGKHFGDLEDFDFAVTRPQALAALNHFIKYALPKFGTYQDAMLFDENVLFHSVISQYLNCGLLLPTEICEKALTAYQEKKAPLNSVEGFIRQILGWREYVRGLYWLHMPGYAKRNFFRSQHPLPDFYWTGDTKMRCMQHVITQTKKDATSHHIQRLMITGNFALLYGVAPSEICEWYLAVYADAYEWVELPNTLGMAMYADGGLLASKPYAASANYINRMSNFCKECEFNMKEKIGDNACPFNYLYWDFLARHQDELADNRRLQFAYKNLAKLPPAKLEAIKKQATAFRRSVNKGNSQ